MSSSIQNKVDFLLQAGKVGRAGVVLSNNISSLTSEEFNELNHRIKNTPVIINSKVNSVTSCGRKVSGHPPNGHR